MKCGAVGILLIAIVLSATTGVRSAEKQFQKWRIKTDSKIERKQLGSFGSGSSSPPHQYHQNQVENQENHANDSDSDNARLQFWRRRSLKFGLSDRSTRCRGGGGGGGEYIVDNVKGDTPKQDADSNIDSNEEEEMLKGTKRYQFSLYQSGDGSQEDIDQIPKRFLNMVKGDRIAAKAGLEATLTWRSQNQVDTILERPHPKFDICKSITHHEFLGRDTTGHIVFFQRPAINSQQHLELASLNNITNEDLIFHYVYVLEYCWNILDPPSHDDKDKVMTSIIDLKGLDFGLLKQKELIGFVQQFVSMMSNHYPQRSYKTLIINAPSWFGLLYKLLKPMLRQSTKQKIQILSRGSKKQTKVLHKILGEECTRYLPPELLESQTTTTTTTTTSTQKSDDKHDDDDGSIVVSPMENELRQFCCDRLQEAGIEMKKSTI